MRAHHEKELDKEKVNQILQKAFEASNRKANTIPLDVLESYSNYRKERFLLQRVVLTVVLIAFVLMPLLFVTPSLALEQGADVDRGRPSFDLQVDTFLPIKRVSARVNGMNMPVYESGENTYTICPSQNGEMEVLVTLMNDQSASITTVVTTADIHPPVMLRNEIEDGALVIYVQDEGLGIDYESVRAVSDSGEIIKPVYMDEAAGKIVFDYPKEAINVFVEDKVGNVLQLVVMLQKAD